MILLADTTGNDTVRILLIHRYFWPDTPPYASMLLTIAKQLVNDGHEIEVLTSQPSYKSISTESFEKSNDVINGVKIKRIRLFTEVGKSKFFKLLNMVYFPMRITLHILFNRKINVIMSSTAPPVVTGFSSALGAKLINAKFIYHCMDIHPEIGKISGEFKNPTVFKALLKLDTWSCKVAENVIVLSGDMKQSLLNRSTETLDNIQVINNFSLSENTVTKIVSLKSEYKKESSKFRILFAGNIGRFQMLESFIDAMFLLDDFPQLELIFLGEGAALENLKVRSKNNLGKKIKFFPHQDINTARLIMAESDLGIVSLLPEIYKYALPSKTMTYLAEGCPLLVTVEPESELVKFVAENKIGVTGLPGNAESIAGAIRKAISTTKLDAGISQRCKNIAEKFYSEPIVAKQWSALYDALS